MVRLINSQIVLLSLCLFSVQAVAAETLLYSADPESDVDYDFRSVCAVGDLDDDGTIDFVAGTSDGVNNWSDTGGWTFSGADGTSLSEFEEEGAVIGGGDLNADGIPDILLANRRDSFVKGINGDDGSELFTVEDDSGQEQSRYAIAADYIGDLDGDGHSEFIVGSPKYNEPSAQSGRIQIYSWNEVDEVFEETYDEEGPYTNAYLGCGVAGLDADVSDDDDAVPDFAVLSCSSLVSPAGGAVLSLRKGEEPEEEIASVTFEDLNSSPVFVSKTLENVGDVDNDGTPDLAVILKGPPYNNSNLTELKVLSGTDLSLIFESSTPYYGRIKAVTGAGDFNGDGYADVAAIHTDAVAGAGYTVIVYSGEDGKEIEILTPPASDFVGFGSAVAGVGDTDDDGYDDLAIVAAGSQTIDVYAGHDDFSFVRGDADGSGAITALVDMIYLLQFLFAEGPPPLPYAAGDFNCDEKVDMLDITALGNFAFAGGAAPGEC